MSKLRLSKLAFVFIATLGLLACGGGGGGSRSESSSPTPQPAQPTTQPTQQPQPVTPPPQPPQPPTPPQNSFPFDSTTGTPSTLAAANTALRTQRDTGVLSAFQNSNPQNLSCTLSISLITGQEYFEPCGTSLDLDSLPIAAQDVVAGTQNARTAAWTNGWSGKGTKIGIVDDFDPTRSNLGSHGLTHGAATRAVVMQIAPEADIKAQSIDLRASINIQTALGQLNSRTKIAYDTLENSGHFIINNSFGVDPYRGKTASDPPVPEATFNAYVTHLLGLSDNAYKKAFLPAADSASYSANMLFVYSAGNSGAACTTGLDQCTLRGKALVELRKTETQAGDRVIFVGALGDNRDTPTLASYSIRAGDALKNDFIVAHDDIWQESDAGGTSFAAPRVAGTAALVRHKFPNLNAPALKQVLLQTADDLGTTGVDNIYGYGQLNVLNALSPIGKVRAK